MKIYLRFFIVLFSIYLCGCIIVAEAVFAQEKALQEKRILVLSSTGADAAWVLSFNKHFKQEILQQSFYPYKLSFDYLDLIQFYDENYEINLKRTLEQKYSNTSFDVLLLLLPQAIRFVAKYDLYPDIPKIYFSTRPIIKDNPDFSDNSPVAFMGYDFKKNIQHSLELFPDTKKIFVVSGRGRIDTNLESSFRNKTKEFMSQVSFQYLANLEIPALLNRVKNLPDHSLIYYLTYMEDPHGRHSYAATISKQLGQAANRPVFTFLDVLAIDNGILGGRVMSTQASGIWAGNTVWQVLKGEGVLSIEKPKDFNNNYIYEWSELKKWGIDEKKLPLNSIIQNRKYTFYELYKWPVLVGILFLVVESIFILILYINITQRKKVEEELRNSEEKFRALVTNTEEIVFMIDKDGTFLLSQGKGLSALALKPDQVVGESVFELYKDYPEMLVKLKKAFKGDSVTAEVKIGDIYFRSWFTPYKNKDDEIIGLMGLSINITLQKQTEEELRDREEQYRAVVDNIGDSIMRYDKDFRQIYANNTALKLTGLSINQYIGKTHREMGFPEHLCELWRKNIKYVFNTGNQKKIEFDIEMVKGPMSLELQLNPEFEIDGSVKTVIGISRDVTLRKQFEVEKKKLESYLLQAQKMEAIGTLAGGIAHDFNNILSPILGFTEMLQEDLPQDSREQESVAEVLQAALRAKDLVKQILTFSRQSDQEHKPVKIQSILKEALKLLGSSIPTTIEIETDIDPNCGVVIADPTQIHQIIMNLATNAYHAMWESGGWLKIALNQTEIESKPLGFSDFIPGRYAVLKVIDTGTGIKKNILDKIFDPYFTTKESDKGTGLGLSVVQGIVKSFKGDIHIYSEIGKGTEVHVYLPIMKNTSEKRKPDLLKPIQGGTERILLVDDEETIIKIGKKILERLGYHVTTRNGSFDALETFKSNSDDFDLIITDMTMPGMTGTQLASEIKAIRTDIPIIICTGFSDRINEETSNEFDIQAFITKPVIKKDIARIIRDVLDKSEKKHTD